VVSQQAVYGTLSEAEHRSTFYIPYWKFPLARLLVPRQRKFQADLKVINDCLDGLISRARETRQVSTSVFNGVITFSEFISEQNTNSDQGHFKLPVASQNVQPQFPKNISLQLHTSLYNVRDFSRPSSLSSFWALYYGYYIEPYTCLLESHRFQSSTSTPQWMCHKKQKVLFFCLECQKLKWTL
jgi:hypothetical protein